MEKENFDAIQLFKASMNKSSSSDGGMAPLEKPDVFISFSEEDTGKGFVSHLNATLARHGLKVHTRVVGLNRELISCTSDHDHVAKAVSTANPNGPNFIWDAALSIVVFSKNYASSPSLLDELKEIVQGSKTKKQIIVPVFYDVEPSAVRKQVGTYGERFAKYEEITDYMHKVHSWKKALTEAAGYSGWDCTVNVRTEHEIVEEIAKDVLQKLNRVYVGDLDLQIAKLEKLAHLQEEISQEIHNSENERNYKATLERIQRLKTEKKFRLLRLPRDLLSHMKISKTTDTYF